MDPMVPFLKQNRSVQIFFWRSNNNGLGPAVGHCQRSTCVSQVEGRRKKIESQTVICGRNRLENGSASDWAKAFAEHGILVDGWTE